MSIRRNDKGQSLVQVLVSMGIMAILVSAMASFMSDSYKSTKALSQKLEALELKNTLQSAFLNTKNCTCQVSAAINTAVAAQLHFDSTKTNSAIDLKELKSGCAANAQIYAKAGAVLPGSQTQLKVEAIKIENFIPTGNADEFTGDFTVSFEPTSLARPLAPIRIAQKFFVKTSDPASAKTIETCDPIRSGGSAEEGDLCGLSNYSWMYGVQVRRKCHGFDPYSACPEGYSRIGWPEGNNGGIQMVYHCAKD